MRRDVVSVSRKSECHETRRCSCRFGCSSAGGAAVVGSSSVPTANVVSLPAAIAAAVCAGGAGAGAVSTDICARPRCGEKGEDGDEEEDGGAPGGRVEPNDDDDDDEL